MELKVWVDGIQRVVCGATFDTTCQDVVIALAHAMGRTGRFSLIEKWRDNERPLTPAECPLRVLQKWGEYAAEVRFVLCQAETSQTRQSQDRLAKLSSSMNSDKAGSRDKVLFPHSSVVGSTVHTGDASVKRSLTFSGAHNQAADDSSWLSSSAPTSKLRRTNLGPVPNGDVRRPMAPPPHSNVPLSNTQRQVRDQRTMPMTQPSVPVQHQSSSSNQQPHPEQRTMPTAQSSSQPPPSSSQSNQQQPQPHPVPSPRHRAAQSPRLQVDEQNNSAFSGPGGRGLRPNSVMPPASGSQQGPGHPPPRAASLPSNQGPPHLIHRPQPQHHPSAQPRNNTSATSVQPSPRLGDQTRQVSPGTTPVQQGQNQRLQPSPSHQPSQPQSQQPFQPSLAQSQQPSLPQSQRLQPSPSHQPQSHPSSQTTQPHQPQTQTRPSQQPPPNNSQLRPPQTTPNLPGPTQHKNSSSPEPPPLPSSPPPSLPSNTKAPLMDHHKTLAAIKDSILASDHSRGASLEIEEYDLDRNFPDSHQSSSSSRGGSSRNPPPSMGLEYRLDGSGVVGSSGPGSGGLQLEGEHAKLLRLVNMQQERLKTQESQLSLVNTEISALEEKDSDYEEKLHVIMEELLLQETRQRDFETEVSDLERVEWANVLHGEQQRELDLNLNIATYKAKLIENVDKLEDIKAKEDELLAELKQQEKKMEEERERLKAEEAKSREEEARNRENISKLQAEFLELRKKESECESMMVKVDKEIDSTEKDFAEKEKEVNDLEASLKDENLKDFATHPVPREEITSSGETIIRILEGRMSPRPGPTTTTTANQPTSPTKIAQPNNTRTPTAAPPVISALATKNQSGVWV